MNVTQALHARRSARAFLAKPVETEKLAAVFEAAARAPSWANTQPWEVFVATGETLERIREGYRQRYAEKAQAAPETPRPAQWPPEAKARQRQLVPDMVRDCGEAAVEQLGGLNQDFFHAPAVIYIAMDKSLSEWSMFDLGVYAQSVMLAATEQGLATIPAFTLMLYPDVLRRELNIPEHLRLAIGIAVGYADADSPINRLVSARRPVGETVRFL